MRRLRFHMNTVDSHHGTVSRLIDNGNSIEIDLPRGGKLQCRNKGFEVGESVCFAIGSKGNVISLLPCDVAKVKMEIAQNKNLQIILMEDHYERSIEHYDNRDGFSYEGSIDPCCQEHREDSLRGENYNNNQSDYENGNWIEYTCPSGTEGHRETCNILIHLLSESNAISDVGEWDDPSKGGANKFHDEGYPDSNTEQ